MNRFWNCNQHRACELYTCCILEYSTLFWDNFSISYIDLTVSIHHSTIERLKKQNIFSVSYSIFYITREIKTFPYKIERKSMMSIYPSKFEIFIFSKEIVKSLHLSFSFCNIDSNRVHTSFWHGGKHVQWAMCMLVWR